MNQINQQRVSRTAATNSDNVTQCACEVLNSLQFAIGFPYMYYFCVPINYDEHLIRTSSPDTLPHFLKGKKNTLGQMKGV